MKFARPGPPGDDIPAVLSGNTAHGQPPMIADISGVGSHRHVIHAHTGGQ